MSDQLSAVFSALSDPSRRSILVRLGQGEATVSELAGPLPISLPAVSRHLKVLEQAGLILRGRHAQWRTSALQVQSLESATDWIEQLRAQWNHRLDRLDAHLASIRDSVDLRDAGVDTPAHPHQAPAVEGTTHND